MRRFALCLVVALVTAGHVKAECIPCGDGQPNYDPGPADPNSIKVEYNYITGEFVVSSNGVNGWSITSVGAFKGDLPDNELITGPSLFSTENENTVGGATWPGTLDYNNMKLGVIHTDPPLFATYEEAQAGITALMESNQLGISFFFIPASGRDLTPADIGPGGPIVVVPEPSTLALLAVGAFGLATYGRRRRKRSLRQGIPQPMTLDEA